MKTLAHITKTGALALALSGVLAPATWAQRAAPTQEQRQESREERQRRMEQMTPEQRQQYREQRMAERMKGMTPEQRQQFEARRAHWQQMQRQQQINAASGEDRQKFLMQSAGISQTEEQDAIIAFVIEQARQRQSVIQAATQLRLLLADQNATPEALSASLAKVQTASKDFRTWKDGALKTLDAKINYSKSPRLQSLMTLVGILGDESADAGGFNAIFPKGVAGEGDIVDLLPKLPEENWGGGGGGR